MNEMFWMGGKLATGLERISHDLDDLREPGYWAVLGSFEGEWTLAKFAKVELAQFPETGTWDPIAQTSWISSFNQLDYGLYVEEIRKQISAGEVYQVNACRVLQTPNPKNPSLLPLARAINKFNPAPFASYLSLPGIEVASASPERFLSLNNNEIISSPIKGTSATNQFLEKDTAENLMIVDLIRNDISAVAETGTVTTPRLLATEKHPGLFHLVSDVQGKLANGIHFADALRSMMPPGSVSGAPKRSALSIIKKHEGKRGVYCGAIGWYQDGLAEIAVGIRTFWQGSDQVLRFGSGAGITWGSAPLLEWEETELKAARLIGIAAQFYEETM